MKITKEHYKQIWNEIEDSVLQNVKVTTVENISKNVDVARVSAIDQIPAKFLEGCAPVIAIHLAKIINLSIKLDTFPSAWKITRIKNFFIKRIKSEAKKYRPIFLLPLTSKVIEKSIHDQTQDYLHRNELLHIYQPGFRANHSTKTCLSQLLNMTLNGTEDGKYTGMILNDLQMVFDTLNHQILFELK